MSIVDDLLQDMPLPKMYRARQIFDNTAIDDIHAVIVQQFRQPAIENSIKAGQRVAIAVGSRGMNRLVELVATTVSELKQRGAEPFVVPAMGSHGGATAEGQRHVLEELGVTEASIGCPIVSSMETVELGKMDNGLPVLIDKQAMQADGIIIINRIKPHTSFSGPLESGLVKMLSIGLGKQQGADSCHAMGFGHMAVNIVEMAKIKIAKAPILFGLATIENAYDKIAKIRLIPAEDIVEDERQLLIEAKASMPRILFNPLDILVVDEMGKQFSGTGTDPNITGRAATPYLDLKQQITKMAVLDLSATSHGNATGVGLADICTKRLVDKIDFDATYANHITSTVLTHGKIPVTMKNDLRTLQLAMKTSNCLDFSTLRAVRLPNTLQVENILISEGLLEEAKGNPNVEVTDIVHKWNFDEGGNLTDIGSWS